MIIALCAAEFVNGEARRNVEKIKAYAEVYSGRADMICFEGFDGLTWDYERDFHIAVEQDSELIAELRCIAERNGIGIGFGYIELCDGKIYSSYMVVSAKGEMVCNYRRISTGWKVPGLCEMYAEGDGCCVFETDDKRFSVMLCGDLWTDSVAEKLADAGVDIALWPVYTDFPADEWNVWEKFEYAQQAERYCKRALLVNCVCDGENRAKGGAAHFAGGKMVDEVPAGGEGVLIVEV